MQRLIWAMGISVLLHGLAFLWIEPFFRPNRHTIDQVTVELMGDIGTSQSSLHSQSQTVNEPRRRREGHPQKIQQRSNKPVVMEPHKTQEKNRFLEEPPKETTDLSKPTGEPLNEESALSVSSQTGREKPSETSGQSSPKNTGSSAGEPSEGTGDASGKGSPGKNPPKDRPPVLVETVEPEYPTEARFVEGRVVLDLLVGVDGRVTDIRIKKSSGYKSMDKAAMKAAAKFRYLPAIRDGMVTAERTTVAIRFQLTNAKEDSP